MPRRRQALFITCHVIGQVASAKLNLCLARTAHYRSARRLMAFDVVCALPVRILSSRALLPAHKAYRKAAGLALLSALDVQCAEGCEDGFLDFSNALRTPERSFLENFPTILKMCAHIFFLLIKIRNLARFL